MAGQIIVFPDAEQLLGDAMRAQLQATLGREIPVSTDVPDPRPQEFILLRRVGGVRRTLVTDLPTILVEAWAKTPSRAWRLAALAQGILYWFTEIDGHAVSVDGEFSGPTNLPDGLSGQPRYTATYSVAIRARETITT